MKKAALLLLVASRVFGMFTSTQVLGNDLNEVPMQSLDSVPFVIPLGAPVYPAELKGTGRIGRIAIVASVTKEGKVHWAIASHGNDQRLREPIERAIQSWRFSIPRQKSKPVAAYVSFIVVFGEGRIMEVIVDTPKEPNQPPEPAR